MIAYHILLDHTVYFSGYNGSEHDHQKGLRVIIYKIGDKCIVMSSLSPLCLLTPLVCTSLCAYSDLWLTTLMSTWSLLPIKHVSYPISMWLWRRYLLTNASLSLCVHFSFFKSYSCLTFMFTFDLTAAHLASSQIALPCGRHQRFLVRVHIHLYFIKLLSLCIHSLSFHL